MLLLKRTIRWNGHKHCLLSSADSAPAKQAIQMCQLDRAGTKSVPTLPVTDVKRRDADEPVVAAQTQRCVGLSGI